MCIKNCETGLLSPTSERNKMVAVDDPVDDSMSTNGSMRSRPLYDGSAKAWQPFKVKAKAHFDRRRQLSLLLHAQQPADIGAHGDGAAPATSADVNAMQFWIVPDAAT